LIKKDSNRRKQYVKKSFMYFFIVLCICFFCEIAHAQETDIKDQELVNKIEELEKRLNELTEESRARRKLEITEQEKQEKEKEVLEAVSREYTLDPKHSFSLDYTLNYEYTPSEKITSQLIIDRTADHTITHGISTSYSVLDNLAISSELPFVYRYHQLGTDEEKDETDIGDISFGLATQPYKSSAGQVAMTLNLGVELPTGRSPFKINPETELSTGSGIYSFSATASFSKQIDPVVAFWNLGYTYTMDATGLNYRVAENYILEKVETGDKISFGGGLAYALSYKVSVNASFSYGYSYSNSYFYRNATQAVESGDQVSASMSMGMGWRASQKTSLSFRLGYSLTGSGLTLTFRAPFTFVL